MAIFEYTALKSNGKEKKGKIDAPGIKIAADLLKNQGLFPTSIRQTGESVRVGEKRKPFQLFQSLVPFNLVMGFTRQFGVMTQTGIPYNKTLELIIKETKHAKFQSILANLRSSVIEGSSLADAMKKYPEVFSEMYVSLVRAGEASGYLADTLLKQVRFMETQAKLKSKLQTAMIYPSILIFLAIGVATFMIQFILPKIIPIFSGFGVVLPLPTRILIGVSNLLSNYGVFLLLGVVLLALGAKYFLASEKGKFLFDGFLLKIPVLKTFLLKFYTFRFIRSLSTLMSCGVDLRQALLIVKDITGNAVFKKAIEELTESVTQKGFLLSQGLKKSKLINEVVIQMISIGEESGQMDELMEKVVENLESEVTSGLERAVVFLEPMIILFMALGIGFIIVSIILPIFEINQLVR